MFGWRAGDERCRKKIFSKRKNRGESQQPRRGEISEGRCAASLRASAGACSVRESSLGSRACELRTENDAAASRENATQKGVGVKSSERNAETEAHTIRPMLVKRTRVNGEVQQGPRWRRESRDRKTTEP